MYLKKNPPTETTIVTNISKLLESWAREKNTWLYSGIAAAVFLVIILLIVLVLRKRIVIAIALVKEGSKYGTFSPDHSLSALSLNHFVSISEPSVRSHRPYSSQFFRGSFKLQSSVSRSSLDCIWRRSASQLIKLFAWKTTRIVDALDRPSTTQTVWSANQMISINIAWTQRRLHSSSSAVHQHRKLAKLPPAISRRFGVKSSWLTCKWAVCLDCELSDTEIRIKF